MAYSSSHPAKSWKITNENNGFITFFWFISEEAKTIPSFITQAVNAIKSFNALGPFLFRYRETSAKSSAVQERFIEITNGEDCYTRLGKQAINKITCGLTKPEYGSSALVHEIIHTLGEGHAHQSEGRDHYVAVFSTDNENYLKTYPSNLGPYDLFSIMHYSLIPQSSPSSQLQLRDKTNIVSHLQTLGLDQSAIELIWDLRSEIGKLHLISYFDVQKLLKIATIINDKATFSTNHMPLCGLIPGAEYKPQSVLKLLKLFTNPSYIASGFSSLDFITLETQGCATINLSKAAQIFPFSINNVNCYPIVNLPPHITQEGCNLFLAKTNYPFLGLYNVEFSTSTNDKIKVSSSLYWKHSPGILKDNCTVIPASSPFSPLNKPFIEYPEHTQQENLPLFNPMTSWQDMGWTFFRSSVTGITHGIFSVVLQKLQNKFKLGFCSSYILSQTPYLLNSLISIAASWESLENANALNLILKLIDENGFIYKSYTDGLKFEDALTHFYPYALGILSTLSLSYFCSKFISKNSLFSGLTVALSIFLSTLSATRNPQHLLQAFLVSTSYLLGNSLVYLADQTCLNRSKQIVSNIESEADSPQRSLSQESPTIHVTPNPNTCNRNQTSISTAFITASKAVKPRRFYRALGNLFFKTPKLSEENSHYDLPVRSTTPVPV